MTVQPKLSQSVSALSVMDKAVASGSSDKTIRECYVPLLQITAEDIFRYARTTVEDAAHYYGMKGGRHPGDHAKKDDGEGSWDEGSRTRSIMIL